MKNVKLYNEEQVRKAYEDGNRDGFNHICISDDYLNFVTPIELPSDEGIGKGCKEWYNKPSFTIGAKWVIEQIKQQNK